MDTEYIEQVWNIEINDKTYLSFLGLIAFTSLNVQHDFWSASNVLANHNWFPIANV